MDGVRYQDLPLDQAAFGAAVPVYEEFEGWTEDITGARTFDDLPPAAQRYVLALEEASGCRMSAVGVGPGRDAIVVRHDLLEA